MGHGARLNFLSNMTSPRQSQELLTVLRTVGDIQKIFSYSTAYSTTGSASWTDFRNRILHCPKRRRRHQGLPSAQRCSAGDSDSGHRHPLRIEHKKIFPTMAPATIVVRGTTEQIAATSTWMTVHAMLFE
jgi:hypothetical protein